MESAPTANNVILIHTVGVDVLDDPSQNKSYIHFEPGGETPPLQKNNIIYCRGGVAPPDKKQTISPINPNLLHYL